MKKQLLLILALLSPCLWADSALDQLDRFAQEALSQYGVPGTAVAVVQDGQVVLVKGYGVRGVESSAPVDADTIFQIASVSKTFTAASLGLLVQEGKLTWDLPVFSLLPQLALYGAYPTRWVTVRDFLAHRSGLPAYGGDLLGQLGYSNAEILHRVRFIEPNHSFREVASYSNVGFFVAGELAKAVSGLEWTDLVRQRILEPLKMERTGFWQQLIDPNTAVGYRTVDGRLRPVEPVKNERFAAAGGMTSTAADMAKWMIALLGGGAPILNETIVSQMLSPSMVAPIEISEQPPIDSSSGFFYGLGWGCYPYRGHSIAEKSGSLPGIRLIVTLVPDQKIGIVAMSNLNLTVLPEAIRAKFLQLFLGSDGRDLEAEIWSRQPAVAGLLREPLFPAQPLPLTRTLEEYAGSYANELYGEFQLSPNEKGEIELAAGPAGYKGLLRHFSAETFVLSWPGHETAGWEFATFVLGPEGPTTGFEAETLGFFKAQRY